MNPELRSLNAARRSADTRRRQRGFVLLPVVMAIALVAAIAYALGTSGAIEVSSTFGELQADQLRYVSEAGLAHARWRLSQASSCDAYTDIPATPFGAGSYSATIAPSAGSPVTVSATGTLSNGAERNIVRENVRVYDASTIRTLTLQPGPAGDDTYLWDGAHQNSNFGRTHVLEIDNAGAERVILMRFDLSSIPSHAAIHRATLELFLEGGSSVSNGVVDAHGVTRTWFEGEEDGGVPVAPGATYMDFDGTNAWASPGGDFDPAPVATAAIANVGPAWHRWDLTALAAGAAKSELAANGVLLRASAGSVDGISFTSSDGNAAQRPKLVVRYACECGQPCTSADETLVLSTDGDAELGGLAYQDTDLVEYEPAEDTATLFFDSLALGMTKKIDALHVLENGHLVLSTDADTTFAGLAFKKEDLVVYDPVAQTATMLLEAEFHFESKQNISSVHVLANGNIVLSTAGNATLGGLAFGDKDLVEYNVATGEASLYFDGDATTLSKKISAAHILDNGNIVLAADGDTQLGGLSFGADQLVEYDPSADSGTLYFDGDKLFSKTDEKIRSIDIGAGSGAVMSSFVPRNILFVVADAGNLTNEEKDHEAILQSWGHAIEYIDDDASQAQFDSGFASNDVVFTTSDVVAGNLGTKLVDAAIGVVTSEVHLSDEFGFSSSIGWNNGTSIEIDDTSHFITSPFATGPLTILTDPKPLAYVIGSVATGIGELADTGSGFGVVTLDDGATMFGGGSAAGRRVQLPWGGDGFDPRHMSPAARSILKRALEWAASGTGSGGGGAGGDTLRDEFHDKHFSGSDGTLAWAGDWTEIGESDGATGGDVEVRSDGAFDYVLRIRDNDNGGEGVQREADLSACLESVLTFDYRRKSFDDGGDYVTVDVSADGGGSWTELDRLSGPANESSYQSESYDISAAVAPNTRVRFLGSPTLGDTDEFYVDNVVISCL